MVFWSGLKRKIIDIKNAAFKNQHNSFTKPQNFDDDINIRGNLSVYNDKPIRWGWTPDDIKFTIQNGGGKDVLIKANQGKIKLQTISDPINNNDAVNKSYVDNKLNGKLDNSYVSIVNDQLDKKAGLAADNNFSGSNRFMGQTTFTRTVMNSGTVNTAPVDDTDIVNKKYVDDKLTNIVNITRLDMKEIALNQSTKYENGEFVWDLKDSVTDLIKDKLFLGIDAYNRDFKSYLKGTNAHFTITFPASSGGTAYTLTELINIYVTANAYSPGGTRWRLSGLTPEKTVRQNGNIRLIDYEYFYLIFI